MKADCKFCSVVRNLAPDSPAVINEAQYFWTVLNPNFSPHLGRAAIVSKEHKERRHEFSRRATQELSGLEKALAAAQQEAFSPSSIPIAFLHKYTGHFQLDFYPCYYEGVILNTEDLKMPDISCYILKDALGSFEEANIIGTISKGNIIYKPSNEFLHSYRYAQEMPEPLIRKIAGELKANFY